MIKLRNNKTLYNYRFELFLATLVFNLFGILFFNDAFFNAVLSPIGLLFNILAGINLVTKKRTKLLILIPFLATVIITGVSMVSLENDTVGLFLFGFYFIFYVYIAFEIIKQVWLIQDVSKNLIIGVISGYITLGLVGFFIFMAVEIADPGSFESALFTEAYTMDKKADGLLYFSYITLMTIGYGEIIPVTTIAQKATILLGLIGQFYLVIITAVVVGKYINFARIENSSK